MSAWISHSFGAFPVIDLAGPERVNQQSLLAVRPQAGIGVEHHALLGAGGDQVHDLQGELGQPGKVPRLGAGDENDVQVRAVIDFRAAQFAQADDDKGRGLEFVAAHDDLQGVLQAGVGQGRELRQVLLEIGQAKDVAQADAHQFGLVIAPEPQVLVRVLKAVAQVPDRLLGGLALTQPAAGDQFIHQVRRADGQLRQEFRAVKEPQQQIEDRRVAVP